MCLLTLFACIRVINCQANTARLTESDMKSQIPLGGTEMLCLKNSCPGTARPLQQSTSSTRSRRLRELPNNLPGASSTGAMGRMPLAFRNSNTSLPNLPSRSNRMYQKGQKRKSLVQLLHDPIARRVCRNIEVQASPSIVRNDKKAVEGAKRQAWNGEKIKRADDVPAPMAAFLRWNNP